ncbi:MAG: hypothetical protein JST79_03530 [Acidobacteria bacterium]|nr:hypothetical protein [Acidobacteriota bacterium]
MKTLMNSKIFNVVIIISMITNLVWIECAYAQGTWLVTAKTNPIDSVQTVTAMRMSKEEATIQLIVRCTGERASVFVDAGRIVDEQNGVRVRFDSSAPMKQNWIGSTSNEALFSPSVGAFLQKMSQAKILLFEFTPYRKEAMVVSFDVRGLPLDVQNACVKKEINRVVSRANIQAKKLEVEKQRLLALQAEEKQRLLALQEECSLYQNGSVDGVERMQFPLPPSECWEVLSWMHAATNYEDIVKRRKLCELPSFASDPKFCGPRAAVNDNESDAGDLVADQKIIEFCKGTPAAVSALKDNCARKWFAAKHPYACQWLHEQSKQ